MQRYRVSVNGKTFEAVLNRRKGSRLNFTVGAKTYEVDVAPILENKIRQSTHSSRQTSPPVTSGGKEELSKEVSAPMPGVIVSVAVSVGDNVNTGDVVAVMEAMKMENNISAVISGTVKKVCVKEGQEVNKGDLLLELE